MSCASRAVSAPALGARRAVARAPRAAGSRLAARRRGAVARASEAPADADVVRAPRPEYIPSRIDDENYVRVFDTTLRDGEQSPGATRARAIRSSPPAPKPPPDLASAAPQKASRIDPPLAPSRGHRRDRPTPRDRPNPPPRAPPRGASRTASSGGSKRPSPSPPPPPPPPPPPVFPPPSFDHLPRIPSGATLTSKEKLDIARNLAKLGVDVIEAGFPIASPDDLDAVRNIAKYVGNEPFADGYVPVICGLSRANKKDIDASWEGVRHALRPRIHTFIATSKIHMEDKLRKTPDEVVQIAVDAVTYARSLGCDDVEFSPEDAGRSDPKFLHRILAAVVEAGATTLNIPDTVGICLPEEFGELIAGIRANVPGEYVISTHCQNDLGLSTANSLAGVANGARQVECTINGIGERAGNASLEEVAMAIYMRGQEKIFGARTGINPVYIYPCSKMVKEFSGMSVQPHKAIVGANAFAHESGIHQDGMLKNKKTYEIIAPEEIGYFRGEGDVGVVMGKHSGRHALSSKLAQLGIPKEGDELNEIFERFKLVAEQKTGGVDDDEIVALATVTSDAETAKLGWKLEDVQVVCGTMGMPTATVKMQGPGEEEAARVVSRVGTGPVDAAYKAVDELIGFGAGEIELVEYSITAVVEGIESLAKTRVSIRHRSAARDDEDGAVKTNAQTGFQEARTFTATGADTDIVVSSARAYVAAINRMNAHARNAAASAKEGEKMPEKTASR